MEHNSLIEISIFVVLGIGSQWLGWRLRVPAILFLLLSGILAGPVFKVLHPDRLFGDLLAPFVSLSVALILFEGGLSLRLTELPIIRGVAWRLVSLGALVTLLIATAAAVLLLDFGLAEATLLGAVLIVTGPTVVGPLLRHIRPTGPVGPTLKWEGIVIDPIGASLAVLVFEVVVAYEGAVGIVMVGVVRTILVALVLGVSGAAAMIFFMRRYWIPDQLQVAVSLAMVVGFFTCSNMLQPESGLMTVVVMGVLMANQKYVSVWHLIEFKENLRVLILSSIFVILAARLDLSQIRDLGVGAVAFVLVLMLLARPAAVFVSTWRSQLNWRERLFLCWMAPRGIVAAAVSSVFALRLTEAGFADADKIVPVTFLVIGATVLVYGLTAGTLAQWLGLSIPNPQGCLIIGAHPFAREIGKALTAEGIEVLLIDSNWSNVTAARQDGVKTHYGDALSESTLDELSLDRMGRLLAMTANSETNALATMHYAELFERSELYQLASGVAVRRGKEDDKRPQHLQGRSLFGDSYSFDYFRRRVHEGAVVRSTKLTKEFGFKDFMEQYGDSAVPLFLMSKDGKRLHVITAGKDPEPTAGQKLISLVPPAV